MGPLKRLLNRLWPRPVARWPAAPPAVTGQTLQRARLRCGATREHAARVVGIDPAVLLLWEMDLQPLDMEKSTWLLYYYAQQGLDDVKHRHG